MSKAKNSGTDPDILDPQEMFLTVDLEDGSTETFQIIKIFEVDKQDYIAVVPTNGANEVYFYRHFEDEEGNPSIDNIDSDDEFEAVIDMFDQLLDDEEFDKM